jgi:4-amino-4-deoxy-L-arabinose transferase-like glycosyltransferase
VAVAVGVRAIGLREWSLWEDEEASIFYALHPSLPFPSLFPVFFLMLKGAFAIAGVSVDVARVFSALVGLVSLWLVYACFKHWLGRSTVRLAVLFMAVNLGHVFWSQSVRYYTAALCFQIVSLAWFLTGFEKKRPMLLVLANVAFAAALLTHLSAILLLPVFVAFLVLSPFVSRGRRYEWSSYVAFAVPLALSTATFAVRIQQSQELMAPWVVPSAREPWHVLVTSAAYFGPPLLLLGAIGSIRRGWATMPPVHLLMVCVSMVPLAEMPIITALDLINVAWYYGLIALVGLSVLSAELIADLYARRRRVLAKLAAGGALVYSVAWLIVYFTHAAGDRPRWKEATEYIMREGGVRYGAPRSPDVFATAPGVVAYYLGVPDGGRQGESLVRMPTWTPRASQSLKDEWYLLPAFDISAEYQDWLRARCTLKAAFAATLGPRDRSVKVYYCPATSASESRVAGQ